MNDVYDSLISKKERPLGIRERPVRRLVLTFSKKCSIPFGSTPFVFAVSFSEQRVPLQLIGFDDCGGSSHSYRDRVFW